MSREEDWDEEDDAAGERGTEMDSVTGSEQGRVPRV